MANGRIWTKQEISLLWTLSTTTSQKKAAKRLGRSWQSVASKARALGFKWRQGYRNYSSIAAEVGCSPSTVHRLVQILYPDGELNYKSEKSRMAKIGFEEAERIIRMLKGSLKHRAQNVRAGRSKGKKMSYWKGLTDEELEEQLKRNELRLRCIDRKERAVAHSNIEDIKAEQARRYERSHGL